MQLLCSFLVADQVYVSSVAAKSDNQYVFSSLANEGSFEVYPDPRGNTLGRGTEIILVLKDDALEYLDNVQLAKLVYVLSDPFTTSTADPGVNHSAKHSGFSSSFPIYQWTETTENVPSEEPVAEEIVTEVEDKDARDEDEALVEDVKETNDEKVKPPKTKSIVVNEWAHLNPAPPIWQRYIAFIKRDKNLTHHTNSGILKTCLIMITGCFTRIRLGTSRILLHGITSPGFQMTV